WLLPYFVKGFNRQLTEEDMYGALKDHEAKRLGDKLEEAWRYEVEHKRNPSLWKAIIKVLSQPLLITQFLMYYEPNQTEMTKNDAYMYGGLIVLATLSIVLCTHNYILRVMHLGMKIRVATCSLIYRKALRLNRSALGQTTVGQMVNLLSNDVGRFNMATTHIHYLWMTPLETIIVSYLLYIYVGVMGLIGTGFLFLFTPFQMYLGKKTSQYRLRTALRTDERVRLMSEIINGIQVIKMYTWEKPFAKLVEISRMKEMEQIRATSVIRALVMSFNLILNRLAVYLCILTYVLTGHTLTATFAYTVSSFYNNLREVVTKAFPKAVTHLAETNVSVQRIQKFLLYEEVESIESGVPLVSFTNGTNGTATIEKRERNVGVHLKDVSVKLVNSTDNTLEGITFGVDSNQLVAVVGPVGAGKTTLLHVILRELTPTEGTVTVEGSLSYASQEPWLFGGSVRQNILFGQKFISKKYEEVVRVCALERDFTLLPHGDRTLIGDRGVTLSGGQRARINLARAIYKDADIYLLDDPLSAVDTHVGKQLFDDCICGYLKNRCIVLVTHQLQYLSQVPLIYLIQGGKIEASGSYAELQTSEGEFTKLLINHNDDEEEFDTKTRHVKEKIFGTLNDYFINMWVNLEQWRSARNISTVQSNDTYESVVNENGNFWESFQIFLDPVMTVDVSIIIYTCLVLATAVITVTRSIYFYRYCMTASTKLHNMMFNKIVYTSMRFFNTNPPGRILNRFSKDIGIVDENLPLTILDTVQLALTVTAISLVIGSLNPWIFVPTLIILVIFYYLRVVFLATSRDIKRVESVTRSPIYTHLSASLQGLTTIRAFGAEEVLRREFDNYQNQNSAPFFMFLAANRTFGFWLDFHCVIYIGLVIVSILFIEQEVFGGNVGLALTQSITLTGMFQFGMRQWSELENNMTSVERIQEYTEIVAEKDEKVVDPPRFWPEKGGIRFDNVCLRYSVDLPYVLKNLAFNINAREKIGIVGRTGAGKSSLISAIFRLVDIEGAILIDGINTKEVELATLRSRISIIPQEPVLFSGTLRRNLDPFEEYSDEVLWNALGEVELKNAVCDLSAGLESKMSEGGSNFSVGQRQLLCLARTIIRNNKILILDEATANVDPHTDGLIQTTIRRKFAGCTVLTIAHRLHTVMDSDKVLVMDAGRAVEFDHPHILLQNKDSQLYKLVSQTGRAMTENLTAIAENSYKNYSF
ncbi:hypothetical protein NQ318_000786, partial [Aromia moschata]